MSMSEGINYEQEYQEERKARYAAQSECASLAAQIESQDKWISHLEAGLKAARLVHGKGSTMGMAITELLDSKARLGVKGEMK